VLVVLLAVAGCSYSTRRLGAFPAARSVAVVPFSNSGFYRDLELVLTQAVITEIRARTSLALATPATADLVIRGDAGAQEFAIGLDEAGAVIQRRLEGYLAVTVTERASGRVVRTATVRATEEYRPGVQGASYAGTAAPEWARRIAEQVVQLLERGF
jgi:hypothetical protein